MAYRFKKDEVISHATQRVFAEEIASAVGQLVRSKKRAQAVHEARKSIKKIRGLLSLLGPGYKRHDRYFRDTGQLLSESRDNTVILQVFDALAAKHPEVDIRQVRSNLQHTARRSPAEKDVSPHVVQALRQAPALACPELQLESVQFAVDATYRCGRKAFKRAQKEESAERWHNFRKQVKQHWYHLRLLENESTAKRIEDLHQLETSLGDDHNFHVLRSHLEAEIETSLDRKQIGKVIAWIDAESHALRQKALEAGAKLYAEKALPTRKPPASALPPRASAAVA